MNMKNADIEERAKFKADIPKSTLKEKYVEAVFSEDLPNSWEEFVDEGRKLMEGLIKESKKQEFTDMVNHPSHYKDGGIETIDFIEAKQLNYHIGNVVKYLSRAGKKGDELTCLKKAQWYLNRYIKNLEKENE